MTCSEIAAAVTGVYRLLALLCTKLKNRVVCGNPAIQKPEHINSVKEN
ncbi:hypothetical protein [Desulfofustis glycolicus]|uniref:Uncharacterized protein n=1 Tax=Desulfofustis glycolicus DSM 9705 TaxID=1121409 RepID=A0A1M5XPY9_9BACT|nr:hypothetical protein [Desulfofustis glycolicus]SHI01881.1 hypothetical protein SAMN02745124_03240 [Desulfofustis glycolicus DSM 9705]